MMESAELTRVQQQVQRSLYSVANFETRPHAGNGEQIMYIHQWMGGQFACCWLIDQFG